MVSVDEHLQAIDEKARELGAQLVAAKEDGVSEALILPCLMSVFRDLGMLPAGIGGLLS